MVTILLQILAQVGKAILMSFLTEKFIKALVLHFLEFLAKKTDNNVDDELVKVVRDAMYPRENTENDTETK